MVRGGGGQEVELKEKGRGSVRRREGGRGCTAKERGRI